jgi:hypothetical protein
MRMLKWWEDDSITLEIITGSHAIDGCLEANTELYEFGGRLYVWCHDCKTTIWYTALRSNY